MQIQPLCQLVGCGWAAQLAEQRKELRACRLCERVPCPSYVHDVQFRTMTLGKLLGGFRVRPSTPRFTIAVCERPLVSDLRTASTTVSSSVRRAVRLRQSRVMARADVALGGSSGLVDPASLPAKRAHVLATSVLVVPVRATPTARAIFRAARLLSAGCAYALS